MLTARIAIIGGGLAGLYAAYLLEQRGIRDYIVLEAREHYGGRIISSTTALSGRYDLGASWFWPAMQPQLDQLIDTLNLPRFTQYDSGDMLIERSRHAAPERLRGYVSAPPAMRLAGGMAALTEALQAALPPERLISGQQVRYVQRMPDHLVLDAEDTHGKITRYRVGHLLLALPPRLAAGIEYAPALPNGLLHAWRDTPTWMAPHAKYVAVYANAFWREQQLSGHARSANGPLAEIHDASAFDGLPALFGFLGVPASTRQNAGEAALLAHCRAQLVRLFGPQAGTPVAEFFKDWAADEHTATPADLDARGEHAHAPASQANDGPWQGCLTGIASEWSPQFPGYLAGAIEAASRGIETLL